MSSKTSHRGLAATGISGLDNILSGGFTADRLYVVEGSPGAGKTTLALQFVLEGARLGQPVLYVTLSETAEELREVAASHGWKLDGVSISQLTPGEASLDPAEQYTLLYPAEVDFSETTKAILADVERVQPARAVFDSLSELRLMAGSPLRYRRQLLAMKSFFADRACTVILLDDMTGVDRDLHVQSIAHGVVQLEQLSPEYGAERRRLRVLKHRAKQYRGGYHDFVIKRGGLNVFPRLVAAEHRQAATREKLSSGIAGLDALIGGGIEQGTSTLIMGSAGTGKTSLAAQFLTAAAERGERGALFLFDESLGTLLSRTSGLGIALGAQIEAGRVVAQHLDPGELSPGEFVHTIRLAVERDQAAVVVVDSLNGYLHAMPEERLVALQLRELLMYLGQKGVVTLLVAAHQGVIWTDAVTPLDASYLADAVILLRYFEHRGEVRQAISVVKKRSGGHERTIRELRMAGGIQVGEPLRELRGVLTGVPVHDGEELPLPKPNPR